MRGSITFKLGINVVLYCIACQSPLPAQQDQVQPRVEDFELREQAMLPRHIVQFVQPDGKQGSGCPAVMIKATGKVGIEFWCKDASEQALAGLRRLDQSLTGNWSRRAHAIFVQPNAIAAQVADGLSKLSHFWRATPKKSAQRLFERFSGDAGKSDGETVVILLIEDGKVIRFWRLNEETLEAGTDDVIEVLSSLSQD